MKIVILDGYTENPGDLSWAPLEALGKLTVYDRTNVKDEAEIIRRMKDGVILINSSRGQLIAEQDLADALNCGKVFAAGLDVVSTEPIQPDNPLLKAKNCIITPHISWAPKESRQRIMDATVQNIKSYLTHDLINVVNDL